MKKVVLTAVVAFGAMTFANAQMGGGQFDPSKMGEMILERLDTDKDGFLSKEEAQKSDRMPIGKDENFAKLDANEDGKLSKEELGKIMEVIGRPNGQGGPR